MDFVTDCWTRQITARMSAITCHSGLMTRSQTKAAVESEPMTTRTTSRSMAAAPARSGPASRPASPTGCKSCQPWSSRASCSPRRGASAKSAATADSTAAGTTSSFG